MTSETRRRTVYVCVLVTVGEQYNGGRGNSRRDEMWLISKACFSVLLSSLLCLNSRLCGDWTYCRNSCERKAKWCFTSSVLVYFAKKSVSEKKLRLFVYSKFILDIRSDPGSERVTVRAVKAYMTLKMYLLSKSKNLIISFSANALFTEQLFTLSLINLADWLEKYICPQHSSITLWQVPLTVALSLIMNQQTLT